MKAKDVKTIHVVTKTWFDKVNGNTYFAQMIVINWASKGEQIVFRPFDYGYSSYNHYALKKVAEVVGCDVDDLKNVPLFGVLLRGCKQKELKSTFPSEWLGC